MSRRILVVDDDNELLTMTDIVLSKKGYQVMTANNGLKALAEVKNNKPDLILADVLMPEMDGYALYKELKKDPLTADIPVLIITGREKMEDAFIASGVDGFIAKPFTPEDLVGEIEHLLRSSDNKQQISSTEKVQETQKILAVGSTKFILDNMVQQAEKAGYVIKAVQAGSDAIAKTVRFMPQVIFVEVKLPDMSSGELIDILRRLPQFDRNPIIGYCYYETDHLDDPNIRREMLNYNEISKSMIQCGATFFMGRYSHQLFIKTAIEYLSNKNEYL